MGDELKLWIKDPQIKYHPSTKTKNTILNGNDIITGGNIIIPIDINMDATTISIMTNGKKIINPISNARRNSEIIKAGMRT